MTWKDFSGKDPIWCPGCGDFGVLRAMQKAADAQGLTPHNSVLVTGIGCSGTMNGAWHGFGFHGLHGRSLPAATGIKLANPDLHVLVAGGDGDGFGIGLGHFMHAARRNVDVTYVVMDNQVYGLTKGQTSPTTDAGMTTKASPLGPMAEPLHPLELAITAGASFVAQGFSGDMKALVATLEAAIDHRGFALVNIQSPCVTYNHLNTYDWFREHITTVPDDHDRSDREAALSLVREAAVPTGIVYQVDRPTFGSKTQAVHDAGDPAGSVQAHQERFTSWIDSFRVR